MANEKLEAVLNGFLKLKSKVEDRHQFVILFYSANSALPQYVKQINMDPLGHVTFTSTVDISQAQHFGASEISHFKLKEKLLKLTKQFEDHNAFAIAQLNMELNLVEMNWEMPPKAQTNVERLLWEKIFEAEINFECEKDPAEKELIKLRKETYIEILNDL